MAWCVLAFLYMESTTFTSHRFTWNRQHSPATVLTIKTALVEKLLIPSIPHIESMCLQAVVATAEDVDNMAESLRAVDLARSDRLMGHQYDSKLADSEGLTAPQLAAAQLSADAGQHGGGWKVCCINAFVCGCGCMCGWSCLVVCCGSILL